ncbi:MAG: hypothetical protein AAFX94_05170, partial [Myxococcota bacterium]
MSPSNSAVTWSQLEGPEVALTPNEEDAVFVAPELASSTLLVFRAVATAEGQTVEALNSVLVLGLDGAGSAPTVEAGANQTVTEGDAVTLNGTAADADDDLVSTGWVQLVGPSVSIDDAAATSTGFVAPNVSFDSDLVFALRAEDSRGVQVEDLVTVRVEALLLAPTALASVPEAVSVGDPVELTGLGMDEDGVIAVHEWRQLSGPVASLMDADSATATFVAPSVLRSEELAFSYTVTDDDGLSGVTVVVVRVSPAADINSLPRVDAGADFTATATSVVTLNGEAGDDDGTVASVQWTQVGGPSVTLADQDTLTARFTAPVVLCADRLRFELRATDDEGGVAMDTLSVTILANGQSVVDAPFITDLEFDDGGLSADGGWEYGAPSAGPGVADSGVNVWGTGLDGGAGNNQDASLCLPGVRTGGQRATFAFRLRALMNSGDGLAIERLDSALGWTAVDSLPAREGSAAGLPVFTNVGLNDRYESIFVALPAGLPEPVFLRLRFVSDNSFESDGAYVDDLVLGPEAIDYDDDGIAGILDEFSTQGTDPFLADSDGDGVNDGDELAAGTSPLVASDVPGGPTLTVGSVLDFDGGDDGLVGDGGWERGAPSSGPGAAFSGGSVWAVNLAGNFGSLTRAFLYLPPIVTGETEDALLTFRLWSRGSGNDGLVVEVLDGAGEWRSQGAVLEDFDGTDTRLLPAWSNLGYRDEYELVGVSLAGLSSPIRARLAFRADTSFNALGPYVDQLIIVSDGDDFDQDGIAGIQNEAALGSDPLIADTDGDGALDGDERLAGTEPLNPADFPGARVYAVPTSVDFESDDGGWVSERGIWQFGTPATAPFSGNTGGTVWGVRLDGNYQGLDEGFAYLPPIDLTGSTEPTLYFRIAAICAAGDGVRIERFLDGEWSTLVPAFPAYDDFDGSGRAAWSTQTAYTLAAVSLTPFVGETVSLRFSFVSDSSFTNVGAFIDDV